MPVIHVSDDTHAKVTGYCVARGFAVKDFADTVLLRGLLYGLAPVERCELSVCVGREPEQDDEVDESSDAVTGAGDQ